MGKNYRRIEQLKAIALIVVSATKTPSSSASSAKLLPGKQCWKLTGFLFL
jgi:hypothetical protein